MVNVILGELTGKAKELYGEVEGPIKALLMERDEAWKHDEQNVMDKIFKQENSTHRIEGYGAMSEMDDWEPVGENGEHPATTMEALPMKYISNETWKKSFAISREIIDDDVLNELRQRPMKFIAGYHRARQNFFAQLLVAAMTNKASFKLKTFSFNAECYDGKKLFAQHDLLLAKGKNINAFSDAFSADALIRATTAGQNFRDDNGNILNIDFDTIVIPNDAALKKEVIGVLEAVRDTSVPGGNKGNGLLSGKFDVICTPLLNDAVTEGHTPWMLLDSRYNQNYNCLIAQNRVGLEVKSHVADNDALVWNGYSRFGGGFVDYRAVACGGLSFGSAL